ncbi:hypothetical protein MNBD_PLANCTO02-2805 [hydrothermal vent metagenome]|uniref:Cytochrome c domain-containing protein n=1 Tax=hydrothermal vent metagenome TaxID=652676 RepID=A0A3B1DYH7_9ZZZZ
MISQMQRFLRHFLLMTLASCLLFFCFLLLVKTCQARTPFDDKPINYSTATVTDDISKLQKDIDSGKVTLKYDEKHGYLKSVLKHLGISHSSQTLVFSKTSFQRPYISSKKPRAVYFSDNVYIGWVQNGDVMEVSSSDPQLGAIFYTLEQKKTEKPKFKRQVESCMLCHSSSFGHRVPAHVVRSIYPNYSGHPIGGSYTYRTTDKSLLKERFGGWYVSGKHGKKTHMGNMMFRNSAEIDKPNYQKSSNVTNLTKLFDTKPYLTSQSDIVALYVLTHQATMHNKITAVNYQVRKALYEEKQLRKKEKRDEKKKQHTPLTQLRINQAAEELVKYMLFAEAAPLPSRIEGKPEFQKEFAAKAKRDKQGRSLRDFDLKNRLFKYPCSFLIYTESFDALPDPLKKVIYRRLHEILTGKDQSKMFQKLSKADRQAIYEILLETKPEFEKNKE